MGRAPSRSAYATFATLNRQRLLASFMLLGLLPAALELPALAALSLAALVCFALIAYEAVRFREARARIRSQQAAA